MPCQKHQHKPWPVSGVHTLVIEACETMCGWCFKEIKPPATNLRAHARRHLQNADEVNLRNITLQRRSAGRGKLTAVSIPRAPGSPTDNRNAEPSPEVSTLRVVDYLVSDTQDNHQLLSLRSRVEFLEGLLAQHGIEVPAEQTRPHYSPLETVVPPADSKRTLEAITHLFWRSDRLENCLARIDTDESVSKHPIYTMVVQYTSYCLLNDIYAKESILPSELDALQLKALRDLTEAFCARVDGKGLYPTEIGLVAAYVQLLATRWFWGMPLGMPADERMFLRANILIRDPNPSKLAMHKLFITTDLAIALAQGGHTVFPWCLTERRHRHASNNTEELELHDPSLVSICNTIVTLIRAAGSNFRKVSEFRASSIRPDTFGQLASRASDLASDISGKIGKEIIRSNMLTARQEQHLAPQTTYAGPPNIKIEERQSLLWLKATYIYAKSISRQVPLHLYRRFEDVLKLRSGVFEIPISSWEGKECMLVWILLPLVSVLESRETNSIDISEKNRRYCKALFLHAAQGYSAKSWPEAAHVLADMGGFTAWLRKDPERPPHVQSRRYDFMPIGPHDEIGIELGSM